MNFKTESLEQVCDLIIDCPHSTPIWLDNGIKVIRNTNIRNGRLDFSKPSFTNEENYLYRSRRATIQENDIIFTREAPIGEVCIIPKGLKACLGQRQVLLRAGNDIEPKYLFYALQSPYVKHQISWNEGTGTTVSNVRIPILKSLKIPRLGMIETFIAKTLQSLDDKIELNRKMNQTLEEMAQVLFKSWFVDFDPVHAKARGRDDEIIARELGISKEVLDLFPSEFVESELGLIPEGWEVSTIDNITSVIIDHRGKTPKKLGGNWSTSGHPALSAKNIKKGRIVNLTTIRYIDDDIYEKWMKIELEVGDVLLTSEAPMGEMYFLLGDEKYCLSQRLYALRADSEKIPSTYLYQWLQSPIAKADLQGRATGTTVVGIKQKELRKVKVLVPTKELSIEFERVVLPLLKKLNENEIEGITLEKTRDTLLPKLLSGELDVSEIKLEETL